jgi:diaminopimelate decarboxylase
MLDFRPHLSINERGHLALGGADLVELAEKYGTPLYVYDEQRIRERYREFRDAFAGYGDVEVCYAYKANTSLAILHILRSEGAGADIVSEGELYLALKVGLSGDKIIFTGNNKSDRELEKAVEAGVIINLDSLHELERLIDIVEAENAEAKVSFRVNPEVSPETHPHLATGLRESKFGIHEDIVLKAYERAMRCSRLNVVGIHMHIGSQITKTEPYEEATRRLFDIIGRLKRELGLELEFADLGGGVGIRYSGEQSYITPAQLAEAILPIIEEKLAEYSLRKPKLLFEPGRYIVGDAGVMLARVYTIKRTPYKKFIGCDAGFNLLIRPAMYGSHHDVVVANKASLAPAEEVTIAGNLCESGDLLAKDRLLPEIEKGDILAFLDAGAYGFVMASQYNSRPRCAEVLVNNGKAELIRYAEDFADLVAKQVVPKRLR